MDTCLDDRRVNGGDHCAVPKLNLKNEDKRFMEDMDRKNIQVDSSLQRFSDLSLNQETRTIDFSSIFEAKVGLQAESLKIYSNLRCPVKLYVRLDFEARHVKTGTHIFVDHKGMIDFQSLAEQGKDISKFPSHATLAYLIKQDNPSQKECFIGLPQVAESANEMLHLINFDKIRNPSEN